MRLVTSLLLFCGLVSQIFANDQSTHAPGESAEEIHAWEALIADWQQAKDWEQIHAAEVLIALGHGERVRTQMLAERGAREAGPSRIGVWRVLARTARDAKDRRHWVQQIETVFADPAAPDRAQAIETMAKLKEAGSPETQRLAREWVHSDNVVHLFVARWFLVEAHDLPVDSLMELVRSDEANSRRLGAYALARVGLTDPRMLQEFADFTDHGPDDSVAAPYLLATALTLSADPSRAEGWRARLVRLAARAPANAQLEAARAMVQWMQVRDAVGLAPQLKAPGVDSRLGAAWVILHAHGRER